MSVSHLPALKTPRVASRGSRVLHKGRKTKAAIIEAALNLAIQAGLDGLSIGALAEITGMSKSGVFAHFGSRDGLQIAVIREYHARFEAAVFYPAMRAARGLPRLRALFANWMKSASVDLDSGCLYISGAIGSDTQPGPVRDALAHSVQTWRAAMTRAIGQAREQGDLCAETNAAQVLFEIYGLVLALHYEARVLGNPSSVERALCDFDGILQRHAAVPVLAPTPVPAPRKPRRA